MKSGNIQIFPFFFNKKKIYIQEVPKKEDEKTLSYLSDDFNYLCTKLNGCEYATRWSTKFTYKSKGFKVKLSKKKFNGNTYFF
jgi:hypothetical protein